MKSLRRLLSAALLISAMSLAALADDGIIHGDSFPTPTPTPIIAGMAGDAPALAAPTGVEAGVAPAVSEAVVEVSLRVIGEMFALY